MRYQSQFSVIKMSVCFGEHFFNLLKDSGSFFFLFPFDPWFYASLSLSLSLSFSVALVLALSVCVCVCVCVCVSTNLLYFFMHRMEQNRIITVPFSNHIYFKTPARPGSEFQMQIFRFLGWRILLF